MFVRHSALCVCVCMCVSDWLMLDRQVWLLRSKSFGMWQCEVGWVVQMFVRSWGSNSPRRVNCLTLQMKALWSFRMSGNACKWNRATYWRLDSLQCHCETLQCIFLCTADSRYNGCRSSSAVRQWSAGSWNKRTWLCSITWRISWGITMYWWRNRPWMQYSNPSVILGSSYRNCRTWGITSS